MQIRRAFGFLLSASVLFASGHLEAQTRPLDHADYDIWHRIQNQRLSPDGRYVTYQLTPGEGDTRVIVRDRHSVAESVQPTRNCRSLRSLTRFSADNPCARRGRWTFVWSPPIANHRSTG